MKIILLLNMMVPSLFMVVSHPVLFMVLILIQAILICLSIWMTFQVSWFSYILFLIFLGGLMVLFMYITSLASNESFFVTPFSLMVAMSILMIFMCLLIFYSENQQMIQTTKLFTQTFKEMYCVMVSVLSLASMVYLFLTLIIVVKMTSKIKGPIRNLIN